VELIRYLHINFNYKTLLMQINNHKLSCTQGFVSPLRVIDQNTSIRAQASPNDFQRFHLSETQRLKRRITNVT
jgi:hypothetical protein